MKTQLSLVERLGGRAWGDVVGGLLFTSAGQLMESGPYDRPQARGAAVAVPGSVP